MTDYVLELYLNESIPETDFDKALPLIIHCNVTNILDSTRT